MSRFPAPSALDLAASLVAQNSIRVVVSDLDGVLRVFDPSLWDRLDRKAGVDSGTVFQAVLAHPYLDEVVRGRGTHAQWRNYAVEELRAAGSCVEIARSVVDAWARTPAVVDASVLRHLQQFRNDGLGVFVFTNGTDRVPSELDDLGLADFLGEDHRFLINSADLGHAKPEIEAFALAHQQIHSVLNTRLEPSQVVFLDDSPGHVAAAERFGWRALHHRRQ